MKKISKLIMAGAIIMSAGAAGSITASSQISGTDGKPLTREVFTKAAESTVNGVVSVKSYATPRQQQYQASPMFDDPFFEFFFGQPMTPRRQQQEPQEEPKQRQIGLGSGVILSDDGYIVTNNHVIEDAERLEVTLNDNRNFTATVVGTDPETDLALIKIEAPDLHVLPMGNSEKLEVGEWVLAVGNPFGFTSSVTAGVVSAKARNISASTNTPAGGGIQAFIQHDAAVNSGNSGGALVNLDGELVGINSSIYSRTGTYAGCSFAIPTSIVEKVVKDLKEFGTVQRALLGITMSELTPEFIAEKKIEGVTSGVYVQAVNDRSGAKAAGVEKGDVIIALNGQPISSMARIQELMARCSPGDIINLTIVRDGKRIEKSVEARNLSGNTAVVRPDSVESLGATFTDLSKEECERLELSAGVKVTDITDGRFKDAGVKNDYIILVINNTPIRKASEVTEAFNAIKKSNSPDKVMYLSGIYPTGRRAYYAVALEN